MTHRTRDESEDQVGRLSRDGLESVTAALKGLRFGQVTITVQDGVIVQIDRTERRRLSRAAS